MMNVWKRSLAFVLALVMVVGMVPMQAFADETEQAESAPVETLAEVLTETTEDVETEAAEEEVIETTSAAVLEEEVEETTSEAIEEIVEVEIETAQQEAADDVADAVAMIGEAAYASLAAAIEAANAGDTVKLLTDVTETQAVVISKSITLDGNGKKLTSSATRAINVSGADGVIIRDLIIDAAGERAINVIQKATNVTVENVTAKAANYTVNAASSAPNAVINIINSDLTGLNVVNIGSAGAMVTVRGGKITCNDQSEVEGYSALALNKDAIGATITANGVTFDIKDNSLKASCGAEGGSITIDGKTDEVVKKVAAIEYGNYYYSYTSLAEAVKKAQPGETIKLLDNTSGCGIVIDKDLTIDFRGYTYHVTGPAVGSEGTKTLAFQLLHGTDVANPNKVTMKNGTITVADIPANDPASKQIKAVIMNYCDLTLEDMTVDSTGSKAMQFAMSCNNGTTLLKGNTSIIAEKNITAIDIDGSQSFYGAVNVNFDTTGEIVGKIDIYGEEATVVVNSGSYTDEAVKPYVSADKIVTINSIPYSPADAVIGTTPYASLAEALAAGGEVKLMNDISVSEGLTICKGSVVTLDLNGKTVSMDVAAEKTSALITNNGTLTIQDSVGGGKLAYASTKVSTGYSTTAVINNGILTVDGGAIENTSSKGGASYGIDNYNTLTVNGGSVTSVGAAVRQAQFGNYDNTVTINGGEFSGSAGLQVHGFSAAKKTTTVINDGIFTGSYAMYSYFYKAEDSGNTDITVNGGTFNGTSAALYLYNGNPGGTKFDADVNGGTFNGGVYAYIYDAQSEYVYLPVISGGNFSAFVHEVYCADGYVCVLNADGTYTVKIPNDVASADDKMYKTLADAMAAGGNVKLLEDIDLAEGLTIAKDAVITLDLNGKTVSMSVAAEKTSALITNNGTLTIKDTAGGGKLTYVSSIVSTGYSTSTVINHGVLTVEGGTIENTCVYNPATPGATYAIDNYNTLTVNGGTFTSARQAVRQAQFGNQDNVVTINGGEFSGYAGLQMHVHTAARKNILEINGGHFTGDYAVYTTFTAAGYSENTEITINGGTFTGSTYLYNSKTGAAAFDAKITGGTFNGNVYVYIKNAEGSLVYLPVISGGTFAAPIEADNIAEDHTVIQNADGTYVVKVLDDVASVGDKMYKTLAAAIEAANAGDTVKLLADVTETQAVVISKSITLDGNGKKLTSSATRAINVSGADGVIIRDLIIDAAGERAINVIQKATNVTVENVTAKAANYTVNAASSAPNAVINIINSDLTGLNVVNIGSAGAMVTVRGGKITCNDQSEVEGYSALALNKDAIGATITANGVTFDIKDNSLKASCGAEGGSITIDGKTDEVVKKVAAIEYGNYYYSYTSLAEAVKKAQPGETIKLLDNTSGCGIVIDKDLTIDFRGYTYHVTGPAVGSEGTKTLAFQLLHGTDVANPNKVTMKNGTITVADIPANDPASKQIKAVIMNYCDLTLEDMTVDSTGSKAMQFAMSCNNGTTLLKGNTSIIAEKNITAIDIDGSQGFYGAVNVNFDTTGEIVGKIDIYGEEATVVVNSGSFSGTFAVAKDAGSVVVTGGAFDDAAVLNYVPYGFDVAINGETVAPEFTLEISDKYLILEKNTTYDLCATIAPAGVPAEVSWSVESDTTNVIEVDQSGKVAAKDVGTDYVVVTAEFGGEKLNMRCRVDVVDVAEKEMEIKTQLSSTKLTTELFSTSYAEVEVFLELAERKDDPNAASQAAAMAAVGMADEKDIEIESAEFTEKDLNALFDIVVLDNRRLQILPKNEAVNAPAEVKEKYTSTIKMIVHGQEATSQELTLTVKKTLPKLKASISAFNSFYAGQSRQINITGGTVESILPNTDKTSPIPSWLALEDGALTLNENVTKKTTSGKAYLLVKTEEWRVPVAVTLSVKNSYKATLKLNKTEVTMAEQASNGEIALKLQCVNKKDTLAKLNVENVTLPADCGYTVESFDAATGNILLKAQNAPADDVLTLTVTFRDSEMTVPLALTVKTAAVKLKMSASKATLNQSAMDSTTVTVVATPADYVLDLKTENVCLKDADGNDVTDILDISAEKDQITVAVNENTPAKAASYKLYVRDAGTEAVMTISVITKTPSVTYKAAGAMDLTFPEETVRITPTFKNYSGDFDVKLESVINSKKKDMTQQFTAEVSEDGKAALISCKPDTAVGTYTVKLTMILGNNCSVSSTVKVTVKRTAVKLKLSASEISLNKSLMDLENGADVAQVSVSCATANYTMKQLNMELRDGKGKKVLTDGEEKLQVTFADGKLTIALGSKAAYGDSYQLWLKADEHGAVSKLKISVLASKKSKVTLSLKAKGTLDVIRQGSAITLTPAYKNCTAGKAWEEKILIYSSADKYKEPVQTWREGDEDGLFHVERLENGSYVLTRNGAINPNLKYKVELVSELEGLEPVSSGKVSISVKMGSAKLSLKSSGTTLFAKDKYDRALVWFTTTDAALNSVAEVTIKDAKYQNMFEIIDYENGEFAIGYKDGIVHSSLIGKKASTTVTVTLNIVLEGNETGKANTTAKVKLTVVK